MRILFAITRGNVGGAQTHLRVLSEGLLERRHRVFALVEHPSPLADRLEAAGATVLPWDHIVREPDPSRDLRARRELQAAVAAVAPDVLHIHSAKAGVLGRGLLRPPEGVTVFTCHHASFGPGRKWTHRIIGRPVEQLSLRHVDAIISVGARDMPVLARFAPGVPVRLVPNAVPAGPEPVRLAEPGPAALWVARMQHPKDPLLAVRAWQRVADAVPGARFRLCGEGPLGGRVADAIRRAGPSAGLRYDGFALDLLEAYAAASVFLLVSRVEGGVTMATLEAMSHGLVPVVTDAGDAHLLAEHGCGVVAARTPRAVASAVIDLFEDPDRLRAMRERARWFSRERWTVDAMVSATLAVYEQALGRASGTPAAAPLVRAIRRLRPVA